MSQTKYDLIKPFHRQQINRYCCGLASVLMVVNSFRNSTQPELRQKDALAFMKGKGKLNYWYLKSVGDYSTGVSLKHLERYSNYFFEEMRIPLQAKAKFKRDYSCTDFKKDLYLNNESMDHFVICNYKQPGYGGHHSPVAFFDDRNEYVYILDVDYLEQYGDDFVYEQEKGEYTPNIRKLWSELHYRGWLLLSPR